MYPAPLGHPRPMARAMVWSRLRHGRVSVGGYLMKVSEHCLCGASATGSIRPDAAARKVINLFWQGHQGEGHGPSTTSMAQESRRREEHFLPPEERQRVGRRGGGG